VFLSPAVAPVAFGALGTAAAAGTAMEVAALAASAAGDTLFGGVVGGDAVIRQSNSPTLFRVKLRNIVSRLSLPNGSVRLS